MYVCTKILMMRIPAEIYDYVSANKRHLVIPHRLMPYPEEVDESVCMYVCMM